MATNLDGYKEFDIGSNEEGTGYYIGDGVVLTAGHNAYQIRAAVNLENRSIRDLSGSTPLLDPLGYLSFLENALLNFRPQRNGESDSDYRAAQERLEVDAAVRSRDTLLVDVTGNRNVDSSFAGLVSFINPSDLLNPVFGLAAIGDNALVEWQGSRTDLHSDVALSSRTDTSPVDGSSNEFVISLTNDALNYGGPGDSGSALVANFTNNFLGFDSRRFVLGTIHSISRVLFDGPPPNNERGPFRANPIGIEFFNEINTFLETTVNGDGNPLQSGDVTDEEPTNLIIGRGEMADGLVISNNDGTETVIPVQGSFRADIILGRGGDDVLSDGDTADDSVWADDQLYGGAGNDRLIVGGGHNLIHGGDFRDYGGGRVQLDQDGRDTADFSGSSGGVRIQIGSNDQSPQDTRFQSILGSDFDKAIFVTTVGDRETEEPPASNTLVSIENIRGSEQADILSISSFQNEWLVETQLELGMDQIFDLAGSPGESGSGNMDLVIAGRSLLGEGVVIDLSTPETQFLRGRDSGGRVDFKNVESAIGTTFDDELIAVERGFQQKGSVLIGADGGDILRGSSSSNLLVGGKGEDEIHLGYGDVAIGGDGVDKFYVTTTLSSAEFLESNQNFIVDFTPDEDSLYVNDELFTGYQKQYSETRHVADRDFPNNDFGTTFAAIQSGASSYDLKFFETNAFPASHDDFFDNPAIAFKDSNYRDIKVAYEINNTNDYGRISLIDANVDFPDQPSGSIAVSLNERLDIFIGPLWSGNQDTSFFQRDFGDISLDFAGTNGNLPTYRLSNINDWLVEELLRAGFGEVGQPTPVQSAPEILGYGTDDSYFFAEQWNANQLVEINPLSLQSQSAALRQFDALEANQANLVTPSESIEFNYRGLTVDLALSISDIQFAAFQDVLGGTDLSSQQSQDFGNALSLNLLGIVPDTADITTPLVGVANAQFGSDNDETFVSGSGNDVFAGGGGNDQFVIDANTFSDVDLLVGGTGDDEYILAGAQGVFDKVVIAERLGNDENAGGNDVLRINAASTDVTVVEGSSANDLRILISQARGSDFGIVDVVNQLGDNADDWIEEIHFSDRVVWTRTQLIAAAVAADPISVTELEDVSVSEDSEISFSVTDAFVDTYRRDFEYSATLANGDPLPIWLSVVGSSITCTPPADFNGQLDISVTGSVGTESVTTNLSLTVSPVNDAPEVDNSLANIVLTENSIVDVAVPLETFIDVDGDVLTLNANLANGDPLPSWLTFDGLRFIGTPPLDFTGVLELAVTASDGLLNATDVFALIIEESINSAPIVSLALVDQNILEDGAINIPIPDDSFIDSDGDALSLSASLLDGSTLPAWLVFDGTRFTGTPPQDFNGTIDLTVTASDGFLEVSDNFTLTIDPVNDAPVLSLMISDQSSLEDEAIDFLVPTDTFADIDGDSLTLSATLADGSDLPAWLNFDGARFTGQPPQDFNGMIELALTASDGEFEASDLFALSISPVNDPPVILTPLADVSSAEDSLVDVAIPTDTFVDVDGDTLTLTATLSDGSDLPAWLSFDGVRITGTPPQDFNGNVDIAVTASDGELDIVDHFVLTIDPVNDAPVVLNAIADINADEDTVVNVALPTNIFSDVDGDALALSATLVDGSELPVWLSFDGVRFAGMPPANFNGSLDIRVTANDGELQVSNDFALTIDPVNDAPILNAVLSDVSSDEDTAFDVALPQDAFADVEGDALTLTAALVGGEILPDWVSFDGERFTGTPPQDFNGVLDIEVTASDGQLGTAGSFALTIDPINDAPVAVDDDIFLSEGGDELTILQSSLLDNDSDVDGDTLSVVSVTNGANGTVGFDADGNIVYTPNAGFQGEDSFTYTISDGELTSTATAQLRVDDPFSGWRQGTEGNDFLFGNFFRANEIFGRGGNDYIFGGFRADYLAGGDGNDRVFGLFGDDHLWGNAGDDKLYGGFGTDTAYFSGTSSEYELQTQYGGFYVRTRDEDPAVNGDDGRDQLYSIERLAFSDQTISVASPIILDLDGDGTEVVSAAQSNALFDLDGDGVLDDTSWIGSGDAFLFLDRNGDGFVSSVGEISFVDDAEEARSDLDGLRSFDSNGDTILSADDARFSEFGVWQDINTNGEVDAGETFTLQDAGIVSIDLNATATDSGFTLGDVAVVNQGTFTKADGSTGGYADAAITFFQKGVPELPVIDFSSEAFRRKSKKYRIYAQNGELMIGSKKGATQSLDGASVLNFKNRDIGMLSPIVLDLDGDGIELRKYKKSKARFDMDGDGSRDNVGWTGKGDGFLVIDRNDNGLIDNGAELSFLTEAPGAKSDLQALSALDSNGDGIVSSLDVRFRELKVWVDRNDNGLTDAGELATLDHHNIASVSLNRRATNDRVKVGNNILLATSTFTRTDGTTGAVGDAVLAFKPAGSSVSQTQYSNGRFSLQNWKREGFLNVASEFEPDDAQLKALRAGLSGQNAATGQGLRFDAPQGANVFDYFEQTATSATQTSVAAEASASDALSSNNGAVTEAIVAKEAIELNASIVSKEPVADVDADILKLALMTQEMNVFGATSAAETVLEREQGIRALDLFAA